MTEEASVYAGLTKDGILFTVLYVYDIDNKKEEAEALIIM